MLAGKGEFCPDFFFSKMVEDPAVQKVVARESGLLDACTFCADVVPKFDSHATPNGIHNVVIYKMPSNVSVEQYPQKYLALIDNWIARPAVWKNLIKFEQVRRRTIVSKFQQTISLTVVFKVAAQQYACQPPPHARLPPTSAHLRPTC
jgi:hypothetical protein